MPATGNATVSDRDLVITRIFDAPRDLVWKAWTEPERITQWLAPKGFTIPMAEGELRAGGRWRQAMVTPDGQELRLGGVYREITPPERLVFTHAWDDEHGNPGHETTVTVELIDLGSRTEMRFRQGEFKSIESREGHEGGWSECFDRLEEILR